MIKTKKEREEIDKRCWVEEIWYSPILNRIASVKKCTNGDIYLDWPGGPLFIDLKYFISRFDKIGIVDCSNELTNKIYDRYWRWNR